MIKNQSERDEIILKIVDLFRNLGESKETIDECIQYLNGEKTDKHFLEKLKKLDINSLGRQFKDQIIDTFRLIKSKNDIELDELFSEIFLHIGNTTFLDLVANIYGGTARYVYGFSGFNRKTLDAFDRSIHDKSYLIKWCIEKVSTPNISPKLFVIDYLNSIYTSNTSLIEDAFKNLEGNARILIAAFLVFKDAKKYKELQCWLDEVVENSINNLFQEGNESEDIIKLAVKYIKGGLFVTDSIPHEISKKVSKDAIDKSVLQSLMGISVMIFDASSIAKRFIKMVVLMDFNIAFDALYAFNSNSNLVFKEYKELLKSIGQPSELYIAWLANMSANRNGLFNSELKKEMEVSKSILEKAQKYASSIGKEHIAKFLSGEIFIKKEKDYNAMAEECMDDLEKFFAAIKIPYVVYCDYLSYFRGEKNFYAIKESLQTEIVKREFYSYNYSKLFDKLSKLKGQSPLFNRSIQFFTYGREYSVVTFSLIRFNWHQATPESFKEFLNLIIESGVEKDGIIPYLVEYSVDQYGKAKEYAQAHLLEYVRDYGEEAIRCIKDCNMQQRCYLLELIFKIDAQKYLTVITEYINDSSKGVREKVKELLSQYKEAFDYLKPLLRDKKQTVRETAVQVFLTWGDEESKKVLEGVLREEKSDKIKNMILSTLKISTRSELDDLSENDLLDYCKSNLSRIKDGLISWIGFEFLPKVRLHHKEQYAPSEVVKYAVSTYAAGNFTGLCAETEKIIRFLNKDDFAALALELLNQWINNGAETKKKWVLAFSSLYGDDRVTNLLKKKIEEWAGNSRGAIASEAVRALALSGSDMALMMVDNISRKFKHKQVKEAALGAFDLAAKELNLDPEDLADRIVPSLEFDQRGERILDFGPRRFTLRLSMDLQLEVFDDNDKKLKSLPSVGKNDDLEIAKKATDDFKALKKQLKAVSELQSSRLEMTMASNRRWNQDRWVKLFVNNPIMHQFAIALIWGAYVDDKLHRSFRYMEDGTFNTIDEEEYKIPGNAEIGLIHPIELQSDEVSQWINQLKDYEINQPFEQLSRKIFLLESSENEAKTIERFGGIKLNGKSLLGKLTKFGWYKGSVQDAGWYHDFYKENKRLGIGAELRFSGADVGWEQEEEVTIYDIAFYKAGTIGRGSYVYDEITDQKLIRPREVSPKFLSEILYDVERATLSSTGFNEKWKERKY